jgi:serine/threonine protein kinase
MSPSIGQTKSMKNMELSSAPTENTELGFGLSVALFPVVEAGLYEEESFHREIEVLTMIRQRSIVKLYGYCSHREYRFLVYQYKEKGSLASILHSHEQAVELDWRKRAKLIKDVAQATCYLHHDIMIVNPSRHNK